MAQSLHPASVVYRLALFCDEGSRVLVERAPDTLVLPQLAVPCDERVCERLQDMCWALWQLRVHFVDCLKRSGPNHPEMLWIGEVLEGVPDGRLLAIDLLELTKERQTDSDWARLQAWKIHSHRRGGVSRLGWIRAAHGWVEGIACEQLEPVATVRQYNGGGGFSLVKLDAPSGHRYWLKAVDHPNLHEFALTLTLCQIAPATTPLLVAARPEWNAWLMREEGDSENGELPPLDAAICALVEVQGRSLTHKQDLLAAGVFDQRYESIRHQIPLLFEYIEECMWMQVSTKVPRLSRDELHFVRDCLQTLWAEMDSAAPTSILHGDLNAGNISKSEAGCRFLDWCEAYIGFAPVSFHHLLMVYQRKGSTDLSANDSADLYRRCWLTEFGLHIPVRAIAAAPLLAAASALLGRGTWLNAPEELQSERRRSYSRTLARHMARAAHSLREGGVLCPC